MRGSSVTVVGDQRVEVGEVALGERQRRRDGDVAREERRRALHRQLTLGAPRGGLALGERGHPAEVEGRGGAERDPEDEDQGRRPA